MEYLPLNVIKNIENSYTQNLKIEIDWRHIYETQKSFIMDIYNDYISKNPLCKGYELEDKDFPADMNDYLKYTRAINFLQEGDNNKLADKFRLYIPEVMSLAGMTPEMVMSNPKIDLRTDLRSLICEFCILGKWVLNKQVLKPDEVFAFHLVQTDKLRISKEMLDRLPYNTFYADISDCKKEDLFGEVKGVFVDVLKISYSEYSIYMCAVVSDTLYFPYYMTLNFKDDEEIEIDTDIFNEKEQFRLLSDAGNKSEPIMFESRNIKTLILQLLCYMNVSAPDIEPSPSMKSTYQPNTVIKNKFREVFVNDVGIKVGKKITHIERAVIEAYKETDDYKKSNSKNRKPPKAHFRRAHWHKYWVGKGRTTLIVKWLEPVFVCGDISSDVIIHDVE